MKPTNLASKYKLSPQMQQFEKRCESYFPEHIINQGIAAQRSAYNEMTANCARQTPACVQCEEHIIASVNTRHYQIKGESPSQTILYAHGGGWYLGGLNSHDSFCVDIAMRCNVKVIAIDYRLAPEYPYPAGLNDCFAVYRALLEQEVVPILMGDSAGANLMAALTLTCKQEQLTQAIAQILIYPALALPNSLASHRLLSDAPLLSYDAIEFCLQSYIPQCYDYSKLTAAFPLTADSLAQLPSAYIYAAQYDPLIDDAHRYQQRLETDGVFAQCKVIDGLLHGGLHAIGTCPEAELLLEEVCLTIRSLLTQSH